MTNEDRISIAKKKKDDGNELFKNNLYQRAESRYSKVNIIDQESY